MDNADLEKLKVSPGRLVPKFKASETEYTVTVGSDVKDIKLTPLTSDSGASYVIKGAEGSKTIQLAEGQTREVQVLVTAEDGKSTKAYSITIHRLSADDASLSQLDVSAGVLRPAFSPIILRYECYLPCSVDTLSFKAKTQDAAMKVSMKDGSPVGTVQLNPGHTAVEFRVVSVSGSSNTVYTVAAIKTGLPRTVQLKSSKLAALECACAVCSGVPQCPRRIKDGPYVYCKTCLEELTRTSKMDPFTGRQLEEEGWAVSDHDCDAELGKQVAVCPVASGVVEGELWQIGCKLMAERKKAAESEEPTQSCPDCSKKVPTCDLPLHKEQLCSAKHHPSLPKQEVKIKAWEKRLVDESCGSNVQELLKKATEWERKYLEALPKRGETPHYREGKAPLDFLQQAAQCYATALKCSGKELQAHIGLGLVMEEFFYAEDLFGLKREVQEGDDEGEAEVSSKEEEFLAICQLHGVAAGAPIALQLKAVEAEYHSLKEAGQTHKAEHVQQLYAWKSKKVLQASKGSYSVDTESPLYRAKLKLQDAVSVSPSDATACYHMGRVCLLLGEREEAQQYLSAALALRPTLSHVRLCLGLALPPTAEKHTKKLLFHGVMKYLSLKQESNETQAEPERAVMRELHSQALYRSTNPLIMDAFLSLAETGGCEQLSDVACLLCVTPATAEARIQHRAITYQKLLWSGLHARALLLRLLHRQKAPAVQYHCRQLSALLASCGLPSTEQLRALQMEVFELGVVLQPSSSEALCHLGNGQLVQFDATSAQEWLKQAELSFRASIAMEGKAVSSDTIPDLLKEQEWWKKRTPAPKPPSGSPQKPAAAAPQKAPPTGGKAAPLSNKQPPGRQAAGRSGPTASKTQPPGRQPARPGPASQTGARKSTGPPARQPPGKSSAAARPGQGGKSAGPTGAGSKGPATLGELKSGAPKKPSQQITAKGTTGNGSEAKMEPQPSQPAAEKPAGGGPAGATKVETNRKSYHPRLGLARALAKSPDGDKHKEAHLFYREVIKMAPEVHDAYIELGEMLAKSDPVGAVDVYAQFPFSDPPSFDDAYLHGEMVRLLMNSESYDDPRLCSSLIAMGKALGIGVLDKRVAVLEAKFKTGLLKRVYAGIHGKPVDDPDLKAFFKFKCWT